MLSNLYPSMLFCVLFGTYVLAFIVLACQFRSMMRRSNAFTLVFTLPALMMLCLFYSLVIHMYLSLGSWPTGYTDDGFSQSLLIHANIARYYFMAFWVLWIFVWPFAFLLCLAVDRLRAHACYLAVYAISCLICFGLQWFAPSRFIEWWWD